MRSAPVPLTAALDLLCVLAFVLIGRASHEEGITLSGVAGTAWPFVAALVLGWAAMRAWRTPAAIVPTGIGVWAVTVAGGMLLRVVAGEGAEPSFIVVASVFLGATMVGLRALALVARPRQRSAPK
ncbi:MAG: DUF3054 domain-containing protein [Nocardiopsaceae bacterium]|nr:DUF3054 domain-containing protein [Nocardiopsaceae bacterium]